MSGSDARGASVARSKQNGSSSQRPHSALSGARGGCRNRMSPARVANSESELP